MSKANARLHPERMQLLEHEAEEFRQLGQQIRTTEDTIATAKLSVRRWRRRRIAILLQARRRYWEHRRHLV